MLAAQFTNRLVVLLLIAAVLSLFLGERIEAAVILTIIVTIALSTGALRMARAKVIVKRLISVEDLGNVDVIC